MNTPKYCFYATLLDTFQGWLSSSEIWQEYWGNSDNPSKTEEAFEKEQLETLINHINRVPLNWGDSEAADRGSAFNEAVDCLITNRTSEKMELKSNEETGLITAFYNKRTFVFPIELVREFASYFSDATCQVYTEATIETKFGTVLLYGYIDELMPLSVHDIKTTSKYKTGKFRHNWQHIVYPYCLDSVQKIIFEYNVALLGTGLNYSTFTELYTYVPNRDVPILRDITERFIEFIEANRNLITDKKIFNELTNS